MKKNHFPSLSILVLFLLFLACSEDKSPSIAIQEANCSDGIQNGNETGIDCGWACSNTCEAVNGLEGHIVAKVILDNSAEYKLTGPLIIRDGGELEIRQGTIIRAQKDANAYIAVAPGGKIYIYGKADNPVIITSDEENPEPGDWGGIVLCGKAPTNNGENARSALGDLFYGGNELEDSSGTIQYLRVEYTGARFEDTATFNGITFYGAGAFTTVDYVQSYMGKGDGFTFIGGTINPKRLISSDHDMSGVSLDAGWNGNADLLHLVGNEKSGIQLSNNHDDSNATPITTGTIKNSSIIGSAPEGTLLIDHGGGIGTFEDIYTNNALLGINIQGPIATTRIDAGEIQIDPVQFDSTAPTFSPTNYTGPNASFYSEGNSLGSGNSISFPEWASGWAREE